MLASDLAELYSVSTSRLNEQVKRNLKPSRMILCSSLLKARSMF